MHTELGLIVVVQLLLFQTGWSDYVFQCSSTNGQYPDSSNCQKYYICWQGEATQSMCPDTTMFDTRQAICSPTAQVNCATRPIPDENGNVYQCPSPYGIFNVSTTPVDQGYYYCDSNVPYHVYCPCGTFFQNYNCVAPVTIPTTTRSTPAPKRHIQT